MSFFSTDLLRMLIIMSSLFSPGSDHVAPQTGCSQHACRCETDIELTSGSGDVTFVMSLYVFFLSLNLFIFLSQRVEHALLHLCLHFTYFG